LGSKDKAHSTSLSREFEKQDEIFAARFAKSSLGYSGNAAGPDDLAFSFLRGDAGEVVLRRDEQY
jgi:hypothetical protein